MNILVRVDDFLHSILDTYFLLPWNLYNSINRGPFFFKLHSYIQNPEFPAKGIIILAHTLIIYLGICFFFTRVSKRYIYLWVFFVYFELLINLLRFWSEMCVDFLRCPTDLHRHHSKPDVFLHYEAAIPGTTGKASLSCRLWHLWHFRETHARLCHLPLSHNQKSWCTQCHWGC